MNKAFPLFNNLTTEDKAMTDITLHAITFHKVNKVTHWRKKEGSKLVLELADGRLFITKDALMRWTAESFGREIKRNGHVSSKNLFNNWQELL